MNNPLRIRPIKSPVVAVVTLTCLMPLCDYASAWSRIGAVEITVSGDDACDFGCLPGGRYAHFVANG